MSIIEFLLIAPGIAFGCMAGLGVAASLHWFFPDQSFVLIDALLVIGGGVIGAIVEGAFTGSSSNRPE